MQNSTQFNTLKRRGEPMTKVVIPDPTRGILALDPAAACGFAHSRGQRGTWKIGSGGESLRMLRLYIMAQCPIQQIACEYASFGSRFPAIMARANELLGIIRLCAAELSVPLVTFEPMTIKK